MLDQCEGDNEQVRGVVLWPPVGHNKDTFSTFDIFFNFFFFFFFFYPYFSCKRVIIAISFIQPP